MTEKFEFYDVLAILVPGTLLLALISLLFPTMAAQGAAVKFPDAFAVICLVAVTIFIGQLVQAIASIIEPIVDWTWGGRLSEKALRQGLGDRYLPVKTAQRIRTKLVTILGAEADNRSLFLFAMQKAETSGNTRVAKFNALYAYNRAILSGVIIAVILVVLSMYWGLGIHWALHDKASILIISIALLLLVWNRVRQRASYYVREVLLTAERVIDSQPPAPA